MNFGRGPVVLTPKIEELIKTSIVKILLEDPKTMPLNVLRSKTYRAVKNFSDAYIKDEDFFRIVESMRAESLIGQNKYQKFFIDYLNYQKSDIFGEGFLEIDKNRGNGFITMKKDMNEYKKSSHFVHKKNLNGAQNGDYVQYVELIVNNPKNFNKFALIDASVVKILEAPKPSSASDGSEQKSKSISSPETNVPDSQESKSNTVEEKAKTIEQVGLPNEEHDSTAAVDALFEGDKENS